ncbi:MAG: glycosyltransferase family 4 protein [Candidatus Pacebacteria bacterium]|nr:glycosyltransferase family 4 protein [Candidatus Paceibacterota bacterium]
MKLIYLSNYNIPTQNALGIQITQMCVAFTKEKIDVELIVPKQKNKNKNLFEYYGIEKSFKVKEIYRPDLLKFGKFGFLIQTIFFLLRVKIYLYSQKYDYLYTREQLTGLFFKDFIYEVHNLSDKITFFHKALFKKAFKVIAITNFIKKDLIEKGGISIEKIVVSPDAVDLNKFNLNIAQDQARNKLELPKNKTIIGYIGKYVTFGKGNKGVDDLVKVFPEILKSNPQVFLLIVGVGEKNIIKVEKLFKNSGINNRNYKIIAYLPYGDVIYSLRASDILIMNYSRFQYHTYYTSPMKMFEYMASGRPIIASDLPSVREILDENNCLFIKPDNIKSLEDCIKKLLQDKDFSDKISKQAYKDVQNYTWDKRVRQILIFLKKYEK